MGEGGVEVGVVCLSGDGTQLAVGREDGSINVWNMDGHTLSVTFK